MADENVLLIGRTLSTALRHLETDPESAEGWAEADRAVAHLRNPIAELTAAVEARDVAALQGIVTAWYAQEHTLPEQDRNVLKRAMKAYRKRLKLTVLDAESTVGGGPMSSGRSADIVGITPPEHYSRDVWDELVKLGRLVDARHGMYELPPGG